MGGKLILLDVRLNDHTNDVPVVALGDIEQCIMNLKHNKAGGYDGVVNEHLIFSDHHLRVHLSLLFTAMLRHSSVSYTHLTLPTIYSV